MSYKFQLSTPPPSLNNSTIVSRGRKAKSPQYRNWLKLAIIELKQQRGAIRTTDYWSSHILIPHSMTNADIDNLPKGIHDALVQSGKSPDDRYLVDTRTTFHAGKTVVITIQKEGLDQWVKILKPSRSLLAKLGKSDRSR